MDTKETAHYDIRDIRHGAMKLQGASEAINTLSCLTFESATDAALLFDHFKTLPSQISASENMVKHLNGIKDILLQKAKGEINFYSERINRLSGNLLKSNPLPSESELRP